MQRTIQIGSNFLFLLTVTFLSANGPVQAWPGTGACCNPNGTCSNATIAAQCIAGGGIYAGDGTTCATASCPPGGNGEANPFEVVPNEATLLTVQVWSGTHPASTGLSVLIDLSSIGGSANQALFDDGSHGDNMAGDNTFSDSVTVGAASTPGDHSLPFIVSDAQGRSSGGTLVITVVAGTGACCLPDGTCIDNQTVSSCSTSGGTYQGNGVHCTSNLCPGPCDRSSIQLNTGYDHVAGSIYSIGSLDAYYELIYDPDPGTTEPRPAGVILKNPAWQNPVPNSQWIGAYATNIAPLNGPYLFRTCFCLKPGFHNVTIQIGARGDDIVSAYLNGELNNIVTNPGPSNPSYIFTGQSFSDPSFNVATLTNLPQLHSGQNCLIFRVDNTGNVAMGLDAQVTINAPGALALDPTCCAHGSTISGQKWNDLNGDGIRQPNEPLLQNFTIHLSNGSTVTTDSNGFYYFNGLSPGTYTVTEIQQQGWSQTYPSNNGGHVVTVGLNQAVGGYDFGNKRLCGRIYNENVVCDCSANSYKLTLSLQNLTASNVYGFLLNNFTPLNVSISPSQDYFTGPQLPGASRTRTYTISGAGAVPGTVICFDLGLMDQFGEPMCYQYQHCVTLPSCNCSNVIHESITPTTPANTFIYTFQIQNQLKCPTTPTAVANIVLVDDPTAPALTFAPNSFNLNNAPIPACSGSSLGISGSYSTKITVPSGWSGPATFHFITTNALVNCSCKTMHNVNIPLWVQPGVCCYNPCPGAYSSSQSNIGPTACAALGGVYFPPPAPMPFPTPWPCGFCSFPWDTSGTEFFGLAHPDFDADSQSLLVEFDGFTGSDGVCFQLNPTDAVRVDIAGLDSQDFFDFLIGASVTSQAQGAVNGVQGQDLGRVTQYDCCGGTGNDGVELTADFSSAGATSHHVTVYNGGAIVADISGHTGPVGSTAGFSDWHGWNCVNGAPAATLGWSAPIQIAIAGGPTVTGDRLRVVAEHPSGAVSTLEDVCLSFNGTPDVLIQNVVTKHPGDMNCDGTVNMTDVPAFVTALLDPSTYAGQNPRCDLFNADFNSDGSSDARDIQQFIRKLLGA